ncbi:MAG: LysE family transporter [Rhodospirillales bacterium]|jgi:threonine efflux protein|nr:LysE family transporter [Rhodospirillales bacterium]
MEFLPNILTVLGVWAVVVMSPGPNFLATTHHALSRSRASGVACAMGVAVGTAVWAASAVFGIALVLEKASWAYDTVRIAGALYLIFFGAKALFRSSSSAASSIPPEQKERAGGLLRSFRTGVLVDLSNPKAATFFTSLFVVMLPAEAPLWINLATVAAVVAISAAWYALAAFIVSMPPVARIYRRAQGWIDRLSGGLFIFFGGRLLLGR